MQIILIRRQRRRRQFRSDVPYIRKYLHRALIGKLQNPKQDSAREEEEVSLLVVRSRNSWTVREIASSRL